MGREKPGLKPKVAKPGKREERLKSRTETAPVDESASFVFCGRTFWKGDVVRLYLPMGMVDVTALGLVPEHDHMHFKFKVGRTEYNVCEGDMLNDPYLLKRGKIGLAAFLKK